MHDVTLISPTAVVPSQDPVVGQCVRVNDDAPFTQMIYMLLAICGRSEVRELTLNPRQNESYAWCQDATKSYNFAPAPPEHIRQYLAYHPLTLLCDSRLETRICWTISQFAPVMLAKQIHVRFKSVTYSWNVLFHRRTVKFQQANR